MKKSNKKIAQNSTSKAISSKSGSNSKVHYLEEYRSCFDWKLYPLTERFLEQLSSDLVCWAHTNKDAIRIEDFLSLKGIPTMTFYRWVEKYPKIAEANEEAVMRVTINREQAGLEEKLNPGFVERTMPIYSKKYRDFLEWKMSKQQSAQGQATGTIQVVMQPIDNSNLVPTKKDTE